MRGSFCAFRRKHMQMFEIVISLCFCIKLIGIGRSERKNGFWALSEKPWQVSELESLKEPGKTHIDFYSFSGNAR